MDKINVIIPAYKPGKEFRTLLKRLEGQDCPPDRIIVMNTEEQYWDKSLEKEFPTLEVHHLPKSEFDHGATRRKAAQLSDSEIMVFMTQDAMPADKKLITNLVRPIIENENTGTSYARQLPASNCRFLEKYTRSFNYPAVSSLKTEKDVGKYGIKTYFCSNVCAAYDKHIYEKTGGFPESAIFNEDMIYTGNMVKAGYAAAYAADAKVIHSHNYSCIQQFHRNFDLGVSQAEHPEIFEGVPSEGEGIRLVKKSMGYLMKTAHIWLIPQLVMTSAAKYAGYFFGKRYRKLPAKVIMACTMNPGYWDGKL